MKTLVFCLAILTIVSAPAMALMPITTLVAGYAFDNDTLDSGPNSLHGTGAGLISTTGTAEAPATAYQYDGFSAYVSLPYSSLFTSTNQISIALWVNVSALPSAPGASLVSAAYSDGNGGNDPFRLSIADDGHVEFSVEHAWGDGSLASSVGTLSVGQWHCVVVTYDFTLQANNIKIFIDGVQDGVADFDKTFSPFSHNLTVGAQKASSVPGGYNAFFAGKIDNLFIFDNALTDFEIGELCIQAVATEPSSWGALKAAFR